jgi:hypothetical protein
MHQQNFPSQSGNMPIEQVREKVEEQKKGPLQCWGCGEAHMLRDFPHRQHDSKRVYNVQEATIVNDVARNVPHEFMQLSRIDK